MTSIGWLLYLTLLGIAACLVSGCGQSEVEAQAASEDEPGFWHTNLEERGRRIYERNCSTCHGDEGQGVPGYFPALNGSELVVGPEGSVIILPMYGRGAMPGFAGLLSDEEIAQVLSYIRGAWDNDAQPISPAMVETFRSEGIEVPLEPILGGEA